MRSKWMNAVAAALGTVALLATGTVVSQAEEAPQPEQVTNIDGVPMVEEDLGRPIGGVATGSSGYTTDNSGREIAVVTAGGQPSVFSAVDVETGERLMRAEIPANGAQVWAYATMPDRTIWFGTTKVGGVFRFDPDSLELTQMDEKPFGQATFFAAATEGETIYFGTYPESKLLSYDTAAEEWRNYGTVLAGEDYIRSLDVEGGDVYVGTGTSARLARVDAMTGDVREIPLPQDYAEDAFVYGVSVREGHLFARPTPSNVMLVYSLADEEWVDSIPNTISRGVSPVFTSQGSGEPLGDVDSVSSGYTTDHSGAGVAIIADRGDPTIVRAIDVESGRQLMSESIPRRGAQVWGYATAPDRRIYFGGTGSGEVYRFDPDSLTIERIAQEPFGQTHFFDASAGADGRVYFGTYPDGKVISYDPSNDEWHDYGTVVPGASYVRSLDVSDRYIYAGTRGDARLMRIDMTSGDIVELQLPEAYRGETSVTAVSVRGDNVLARTTPANVMLAYSLSEERWIDEVPEVVGHSISPIVTTTDSGQERDEVILSRSNDELIAYDVLTHDWRVISTSASGSARGWGSYVLSSEDFPGDSLVTVTGEGDFLAWSPRTGASETFQVRSDAGPRTEVLMAQTGSDVIAYDLVTHEQRVVSLSVAGAARGWGVQHFKHEDFPGESLVMARGNGVFLAWNPETEATETFRPDVARGEYFIRSMATGPEGNAWIGGYLQGIGMADADTGDTRMFAASGQPESMVSHGDYVVYGTYSGGQLWSYDSSDTWRYGTNPGPGVTIGEEQDRPVAMASAGDVVAVGSVPYYGEVGGALSLFDPATGGLEVFRNVVQDQSVLSLAYRDGLIYGGTGIWGGLGTEPTTEEGHLFIFDPSTNAVVYSGVPVPGAENVSALTFDDDGNLWGLTYGELFKFDPETREVVHIETYMEGDTSGAYWTGRELFWHAGKLVGSTALGWGSGERIFEIDPESLEMTVLVDDAINLAIDRNGSYYYSRGSSLYRLVPQQAPVCDRVITDRQVGGVRVVAGERVCLDNADIHGDVVVEADGSLVVTTTSIRGSVEVNGAESLEVRDSSFRGAVMVRDVSGDFVFSGSEVRGSLSCTGNANAPDDEGDANSITGAAEGQCAEL